MVTEQEKQFLAYWKANRVSKKKVVNQLSVGLPLGTVLVVAIFVNLLSGWFGRAMTEFKSESSSLVLVLLLAGLGIVVFVTIFSVRHRWDMNEQRYLELTKKLGSDGSDSEGPAVNNQNKNVNE